jgi:hypothetical protein
VAAHGLVLEVTGRRASMAFYILDIFLPNGTKVMVVGHIVGERTCESRLRIGRHRLTQDETGKRKEGDCLDRAGKTRTCHTHSR